ncbi:MAG: helix-turn-helix transcriptional regulator [Streptosporangiaceae bacterium]
MSDETNTGPADPNLSVGERIKFFRTRRGMSREVLGGLVGKSARWVKAVETGQMQQPKLPTLISLAEVLRVQDIGQLTGGQAMPVSLFRGPGHRSLPEVRDAINAVGVPANGPRSPLPHLQARLDSAWRARHAAPDHRTVLGTLLPDLIRDAKHATRTYEGPERRQAFAVLAGVFNLAQFYLAYQPDSGLLWRAAERAVMAAEESEDPKAFGDAVWGLAQAHRDAGDFDAAEAVNREALEVLRPGIGDAADALRGTWGALHFEMGFTAARAGQQGTAWRWWEQADLIARTLPAEHYDLMTSFGRTIMPAHAVTIAVELRQRAEGIRQANRSVNAPILSRPRRGRHLIEVARAWHLGGDPAAVLGTLQRAYSAAPETARYNGYCRRMVLDLTEGPAVLRQDAHDLAERVGLLV